MDGRKGRLKCGLQEIEMEGRTEGKADRKANCRRMRWRDGRKERQNKMRTE